MPGRPLFFATALPLGGQPPACSSRATWAADQDRGEPRAPGQPGRHRRVHPGRVLSLYDPDRSQVVSQHGRVSTWERLPDAGRRDDPPAGRGQGAGLRLLTESVTRRRWLDQIRRLLEDVPRGEVAPATSRLDRDDARAGARLAFGEDVEPIYHFDQADVVLSLDADFLATGRAAALRARLRRAARARGRDGHDEPALCRGVHAVLTGAMADHRLPCRRRDIRRSPGARAGAEYRGRGGTTFRPAGRARVDRGPGTRPRAIAARAWSWPATMQPPAVHALAHAINDSLGNLGETVRYTRRSRPEPGDQVVAAPSWSRTCDRGHGRDAAHPRRQPGLRRPAPTSTSPGR